MALKLGEGIENPLFKHSKEYSQGIATRGIRIGAATFVVALDGSGDFTDIQAAIDALEDTGKIIIKDGTYTITQKILSAKNNLILEGFNDSTVITGANLDKMIEMTGNNVIVRNLKILSTGSQVGMSGSIHITGNYGIIDGVSIVDANAYGISATGANCKIQNCFINNAEGVSIYISGTGTIIKNNYLENGGNSSAIYGSGASDSTIQNNIIKDCLRGIIVSGRSTIIGNVVQNIDNTYGISIQADNCVVKGNRVIDIDNDGISTSGDYGTFIGNSVYDTRGVGAVMPYALDERIGADYNIFVGNATYGSVTGTINVVGANTINQHNI